MQIYIIYVLWVYERLFAYRTFILHHRQMTPEKGSQAKGKEKSCETEKLNEKQHNFHALCFPLFSSSSCFSLHPTRLLRCHRKRRHRPETVFGRQQKSREREKAALVDGFVVVAAQFFETQFLRLRRRFVVVVVSGGDDVLGTIIQSRLNKNIFLPNFSHPGFLIETFLPLMIRASESPRSGCSPMSRKVPVSLI